MYEHQVVDSLFALCWRGSEISDVGRMLAPCAGVTVGAMCVLSIDSSMLVCCGLHKDSYARRVNANDS